MVSLLTSHGMMVMSHKIHRGHNELDNPSLTQPTMYNVIDKRPTVPDLYTNELEVTSTMCYYSHAITRNVLTVIVASIVPSL